MMLLLIIEVFMDYHSDGRDEEVSNSGVSWMLGLLLTVNTITFLYYEIPQIRHFRWTYLAYHDNITDVLQLVLTISLCITKFYSSVETVSEFRALVAHHWLQVILINIDIFKMMYFGRAIGWL